MPAHGDEVVRPVADTRRQQWQGLPDTALHGAEGEAFGPPPRQVILLPHLRREDPRGEKRRDPAHGARTVGLVATGIVVDSEVRWHRDQP